MEHDFFGLRGAKTRKRRRSPQKMESARAQWGGLRRGKKDVQAPRTFESRTGSEKISGKFEEDLVASFSTPSPVGRRIEDPHWGEYRRPMFSDRPLFDLEEI